MFEISWSELFILVVVTLIFVKPKDLPYFFNTLGRYFGEMKRQASEFRRHFEDAMREAEMENLRKEFGEVGDKVNHAFEDVNNLTKVRVNDGGLADKSSIPNSLQTPSATALQEEPSLPTQSDRSSLKQIGDP